MTQTSKVLALGEGAETFAKTVFPDADIATGDSDMPEEPVAGIVLMHVLPTFTYSMARAMMLSLVDKLAPGGRFYLLAPSGEMAAIQRARGKTDGVAEAILHGRQWAGEVYQSSWTILALRSELSEAGLVVTQSLRLKDQWPAFGDAEGRSVEIDINCVVGEKRGPDA